MWLDRALTIYRNASHSSSTTYVVSSTRASRFVRILERRLASYEEMCEFVNGALSERRVILGLDNANENFIESMAFLERHRPS